MSSAISLRLTLKSSASFRLPVAVACGIGLLAITPLSVAPASANPVGGAVTTGSVSISTSSNKTNVNQKSEDVVIDWSSFNIGAGQTTQFVQPNAQAIAVNRIGGADASQILGTLDANGRVVLINGNGVLFGRSSQVNVGSLIATSTDGSDSDVLSGKFTQAGKQNASVVNNGAITAASGGVVALVAPNVTNTGTVNAKLGTVALGAANKFTVDFTGDGLVSFAAQGDVNARASAINSGLLSGANVSMTARAANGIATGIVNMSGIITAQGVENVGGTIYLNAGNGTLTTTGTLNAAGATGGGHIETSGETANFSGRITAGKGGQWNVDPEDLTIDSSAATTIDLALNGGTSVLEQTTSGAASGTGNQTSGEGDITVASALTWNSTATLTLDSYHSINIAAPITISGAGSLVLKTDDGGTGGVLSFDLGSSGFAGNVSYGTTNNGGTLAINSTNYTLVYSMTETQAINSNLTGNYALANSLDASGTTGWIPLGASGSGFTGIFEGLGNTISNLTVDLPTTGLVGLFGKANGTIRDLGLVGGSISGDDDVGGLVGLNFGTIDDSYATAAVNSSDGYGGGLAGVNNGGMIDGSFATGSVGSSGSVSSGIGGVTGYNTGTIENSYATGAVSASGSNDSDIGGLVGNGQGGVIEYSYATGAVSAGNSSYDVGGLIGANYATIDDSYALGAASGVHYVGGLAGTNDGTISATYSAGAVSGSTDVGGLVGDDFATAGHITSSYWDTHASGITNLSQGAGNVANDSGIAGETTAALQAGLPSGFSSLVWAIVPGVSYPYLQWQFNGAPQVVAGFTVASNGKTDVSGLDVSLLVNGESVTPAVDMNSGANGYYYLLLAPDTISNSGSPVFAYLTNGTPGNAYAGNMLGSDGDFEIEEGQLRVKSGASSATGLFRALNTAVGSNTGTDFLYTTSGGFAPNANLFIDDSAATFNINTDLDVGTGTLWLYDPTGSISESGDGAITAGLLRGTSENGVTLNGANDIARLGQFGNVGSGGFSLTNSDTLDVVGAVNAGTGDLSLITTANGIVIAGDLTAGGTVDLQAGSGIWQDPKSSVITAETLTGSANGATNLQGANSITDLGTFDVNDANFYLTNNQTLTVTGTVGAIGISLDTTTGDLVDSGALHANEMTLTSLLGEIYGTGNINATVLNVTADTGIDLDGTSNNIEHVKTDTTNSGSNVINTHDTAD